MQLPVKFNQCIGWINNDTPIASMSNPSIPNESAAVTFDVTFIAFPTVLMHWILFPARAPKAPSPAHAAPVTAPEIAPLNAPSANPSRNDPHLSQRLFLQPLPYQSSGQCSPECSCQYDSQYPACQSRRYPQSCNNYRRNYYFSNGFPILLHHSATDFKPSLIFPSRFSRFPVLNNNSL